MTIEELERQVRDLKAISKNVDKIIAERDELKRQLEACRNTDEARARQYSIWFSEELDKMKGAALQNQALRGALEALKLTGAIGTLANSTSKLVVDRALALPPTAAEKVVAALQELWKIARDHFSDVHPTPCILCKAWNVVDEARKEAGL